MRASEEGAFLLIAVEQSEISMSQILQLEGYRAKSPKSANARAISEMALNMCDTVEPKH